MSLYFSQVYDSFSTAMHPPLNIAELSFLCFVFGICRSPFAPAKPSGFISDPCSRQLAAAPREFKLEKGRSPPRPLRPLGSGGTDSALRLVTCWSSDALRLSSSGQTSRFHPHPKLSYTATPRSCRKRPLATLPSLQLQCELSALIN
jgi:hypothetical protein